LKHNSEGHIESYANDIVNFFEYDKIVLFLGVLLGEDLIKVSFMERLLKILTAGAAHESIKSISI
jgi:hypothetical protein